MSKTPVFVTVTLDEPIVRGEQTIAKVVLRRPGAGEMRGLSLLDVGQIDVDALVTLLPRISDPTLTQADVLALDPADLMAMGAEVTGFLLPKASRPASPTT